MAPNRHPMVPKGTQKSPSGAQRSPRWPQRGARRYTQNAATFCVYPGGSKRLPSRSNSQRSVKKYWLCSHMQASALPSGHCTPKAQVGLNWPEKAPRKHDFRPKVVLSRRCHFTEKTTHLATKKYREGCDLHTRASWKNTTKVDLSIHHLTPSKGARRLSHTVRSQMHCRPIVMGSP